MIRRVLPLIILACAVSAALGWMRAGTSAGPKIGGAKTVRNVRHVSLIGEDNVIQTVKAGDVLDSGWEIKSINRKRVIAVFDGQELDIPINSYLQEAFEKPDEGAMDNAGSDASMSKATQRRPGGGE